MESLKQKILEKAFYVWHYPKDRKKESRKECQGKSCPIYNDAGYSMHCGSFISGWCNHNKYGIESDVRLVIVDDVVAVLDELFHSKELLEKLALLEHNQWSELMEYMDKKVIHGETTVEFTNETWNEWLRKASFHYCDLTEEEKESDRKFARKVLAVLEGE